MSKQPVQPSHVLRRLGEKYHHVEQEHHRQPASREAVRRRLASRLAELEDEFERTLAAGTADESLRDSWRAFLRGRAAAPEVHEVARPPQREGRTDAGAPVELRPARDGHDRNVCVVVADATRARVLALDVERPGPGPTTPELVELVSVTNPMLRTLDAAAIPDGGSGRRHGVRMPLHAPDHRDQRRREIERHFAAIVAEETAAVWRLYPSCELVVVAPPGMLELLRPAIDRQRRAEDAIAIREVPGDHTRLSTPRLHDLLVESRLLPVRGRRASVPPAASLPA